MTLGFFGYQITVWGFIINISHVLSYHESM